MKKTSKRMKMKDVGVSRMDAPVSHVTAAGDVCPCVSCANECSGWGLTLLRVVVGLLFALHGIQKLMGIGDVSGFFGTLGIAGWVAWLVAVAEVVGGVALVIGFWTRYAGYLLGLVMIGALTFASLGWGALSWVFVVAAAIAMVGLCTKPRRWACWLLAAVLVIVLVAAFVMQLKSGINLAANVERDMVLLAALFTLAWLGPGRVSIHERCGCCP